MKRTLIHLASFALLTSIATPKSVDAAPGALKADAKSDKANTDSAASDHYICLKYNNCGKCNGNCIPRNPETPGLTPEEKKQAEENQKNNPKGKKFLCGAAQSNEDAGDSLSYHTEEMKEKRLGLQQEFFFS